MNAALIALGARCGLRGSVEGTAGCNHVGGRDLQAFRSDDRIARCLIESRDNSSAELGDFRERVHFAAIVRGVNRLPNARGQALWHEPPSRHLLCRAQLGIELRESHIALLGAGARAERGIE